MVLSLDIVGTVGIGIGYLMDGNGGEKRWKNCVLFSTSVLNKIIYLKVN